MTDIPSVLLSTSMLSACSAKHKYNQHYKKLCRCRGTVSRATNTQYRTWWGLQYGM